MDYNKQDIISLYDQNDIEMMNKVEIINKGFEGRIQNIIKYAELSGIKKIGIAHCISVSRLARQLESKLSEKFEVFTVDCKVGRIDRSELLSKGRGAVCNPVMQAKFLNDNETELNIVMALCLGHDILFNKYSEAPTTTLLVKDEVYGDPFEAIR